MERVAARGGPQRGVVGGSVEDDSVEDSSVEDDSREGDNGEGGGAGRTVAWGEQRQKVRQHWEGGGNAG